MAEVKWANYNEKDPWGKGSFEITADNEMASRTRHAAIMAVREHRETPEQAALVAETDVVMSEAVAQR